MNRRNRQLVYGIGCVVLGMMLLREEYSHPFFPNGTIALMLILAGLLMGGSGTFRPDR